MSDVPARIGPYAIESRLGAGGMAETFVATRNMQGVEQRVCVKRILPAYAKDANARKLFMREASISAGLRHANLVTVLDVGEDRGAPYLVMELVDGADLGAILAASPGKRLPPDLVAFVLAEMAHGLHEAHGGGGAHAGVVHRDLSPSNVLISTMGEVKVADFGIAKALSGEKATATLVRGKFAYMAPEQLDGAPLDPRADFFALGVMGYEMIAGVRPFDSDHDARLVMMITKNERRSVFEVAPDAPRDLLETIEALLSPKREDRPADGHAIVERLAPIVPPSMVARRKIGALAKTALAARLSGESQTGPSADEPSAGPAFAPTLSAPEPRPPVVGPLGTHGALDAPVPASRSPGLGRPSLAMFGIGLAVVFAGISGGAFLFFPESSPPDLAGPEPVGSAPPIAAPTAPSIGSPAPPTTPVAPPVVPPIPSGVTTPIATAEPPAHATHPASSHGSHRTPPATEGPLAPGASATSAVEEAAPTPGANAVLNFVVTPWGNIWVDNRYLGRAPVRVEVTAGSHRVQAGYDSPQTTRTVRVRAGQHLRVDFELTDP